jgi:hypothetical protein
MVDYRLGNEKIGRMLKAAVGENGLDLFKLIVFYDKEQRQGLLNLPLFFTSFYALTAASSQESIQIKVRQVCSCHFTMAAPALATSPS